MLSAGQGSKGHRLYNWLLVDPGADAHLLLERRSVTKPDQLAYYICRRHTPVPLAELVRVAGSRWGVEETFPIRQKRDRPRPLPGTPLRRLVPTHHLVHALPPRFSPSPPTPNKLTIKRGATGNAEDLIPLSCNEIRRLWATLSHPTHPRHHTHH